MPRVVCHNWLLVVVTTHPPPGRSLSTRTLARRGHNLADCATSAEYLSSIDTCVAPTETRCEACAHPPTRRCAYGIPRLACPDGNSRTVQHGSAPTRCLLDSLMLAV